MHRYKLRLLFPFGYSEFFVPRCWLFRAPATNESRRHKACERISNGGAAQHPGV